MSNAGDTFTSKNGNTYTLAQNARTLANGAVAAKMTNNRFVIMSGTKAGAAAARAARFARASSPLSRGDAQGAFDAYYKTTRHFSRGPRKGQRVYKSSRGRKAARTYDLNHTSKNVIGDMRYANRHGPRLHDYQGVDTGDMVRKPMSAKQSANLAKGRAALAAKRAGQTGGFWW